MREKEKKRLGKAEKTVKSGKGKNEGDKRNTNEEEGE